MFLDRDDKIRNFDRDDGTVNLSSVGSNNRFSDLSNAHMIRFGNDVEIDAWTANMPTLPGVVLADRDKIDFVF